MRITPVRTTSEPNFGGFYGKNKGSKEQKAIIKLLRTKLTNQAVSGESLVQNCKRYGYDLIATPIDGNLVSLDATDRFSYVRWLFQKNYAPEQKINIGIYNKEATESLEEDLKREKPFLKLLALL